MYIAKNWEDFEVLDCGDGEKLERFGDKILIRPDPQAIWKKTLDKWDKYDGYYTRSATGGGEWSVKNLPSTWQIKYKELVFNIKPMNFKHTGIFPEQAANWDFMMDMIKSENRDIKVLNLFAYTGGATLACASAGASVCHVDASKGMVAQAKENAISSGLDGKPIRWIVDDCKKFIEREIRRGNKYDAIIMDPPSYGRGPTGEIWKIEEDITDFISLSAQVLSENPLFMVINTYTTGFSPSVIGYILKNYMPQNGEIETGEIGLLVKSTGGFLPCGATTRWKKKI